MTDQHWEQVWQQVRGAGHSIVVGARSLTGAPSDLKILSVMCAPPWKTGGPLEDARRRIEHLLAAHTSGARTTGGQTASHLHFLPYDEPAPASADSLFVDACNQLAEWLDGHAALCLEALDEADAATLAALQSILQRPGWLRLPLIMTVNDLSGAGIAALAEQIQQQEVAGVVIRLGSADQVDAAPAGFDWTTLPTATLQVLRAGSMIGSEFEAELVARLCNLSLGEVLQQLQYAADQGAPLADREGGRFLLPPQAVDQLQSRLLPSLKHYWHERLGELLAGRPTHQSAVVDAAAASSFTAKSEPSAQSREEIETKPGYAELFEPSGASADAANDPDMTPPQAAVSTPPPPVRAEHSDDQAAAAEPPDQARAAQHLHAAGQTAAAIGQYLAATRELIDRGDARRAYFVTQQALQLLQDLPRSPQHEQLRLQLLIARAEVQWQGAALGSPFTLGEALQTLETARAYLTDDTAADVLARLAIVTAGVCYDRGDLASLELALGELAGISRQLMSQGDAVVAASLLSRQASLYVRLGDPVRATYLLDKARHVFEAHLRNRGGMRETFALEELALIEHLTARLPLHAKIRSGREAEAFAQGLQKSRNAADIYRQLGRQRELARCWETAARLELGRGSLQAAHEQLSAVLKLQKQIGDITGLARSTAALADLYVANNQFSEALTLINDSIELNFEKGSPIGLAFNRRALTELSFAAQRAPRDEDHRLLGELAVVEQKLNEAQSVLGRIGLPGDSEDPGSRH